VIANGALGVDSFDVAFDSSAGVHVAWVDFNNDYLQYSRSLDDGATFAAATTTDNSKFTYSHAKIAVRGSAVTIGFQATSGNPNRVFAQSSQNRGANFATSVALDAAAGNSSAVALTYDVNGNAVVTFLQSFAALSRVFVSRSFDTGQSFSAVSLYDNQSAAAVTENQFVTDDVGNGYGAWIQSDGTANRVYARGSWVFPSSVQVSTGGSGADQLQFNAR
jgi:hypothetical protein